MASIAEADAWMAPRFLVLISVASIGEGLELRIPRGYMYFTIIFSMGVELLAMRMRRRAALAVHLKWACAEEPAPAKRPENW